MVALSGRYFVQGSVRVWGMRAGCFLKRLWGGGGTQNLPVALAVETSLWGKVSKRFQNVTCIVIAVNRQLVSIFLRNNSLEKSTSRDADSLSVIQDIPYLLWNPHFDYRVHKNPPVHPTGPGGFSLDHISLTSILILSSMPRFFF
jgi:hypothetical protein